ncbi:hypothetical protein VTK26DRAFT_7092 [Humicola hyalothermophila]
MGMVLVQRQGESGLGAQAEAAAGCCPGHLAEPLLHDAERERNLCGRLLALQPIATAAERLVVFQLAALHQAERAVNLAHERADVHGGRSVVGARGLRGVEHAERYLLVLVAVLVRFGVRVLPRERDALAGPGLALQLGDRVQLEKRAVHAVGVRMGRRTRPQLLLLFP